MAENDYTDYNPSVLRVTAFQIPPWIVIDGDPKAGFIKSLSGPLKVLLDYLSHSMKFKYHIMNNTDPRNAHGRFNSSHWVGLLGLLYRNEVDFTVVPAGPNTMRCNASRMPLPFAYTDMTILSGESLPNEPEGVSTFDNMSIQVWLCYISCFLFSSLVSWIAEGSASVRFLWGKPENSQHKFSRFCWEYIGCVFSKEIRLPMNKVATRLILSMWLLGGLIITTIIGGDMTASMAIVLPPFTIDKLNDLDLKPKLRADIMENSGHKAFVEANNRALFNRIETAHSAKTMPHLMNRDKFEDIINHKAVAINDRYTLLSAIQKYCDSEKNNSISGFYFAKSLITEVPVSMFFNKRLSKEFMNQVNIRMLRIFQYGIQVGMLDDSLRISPLCFAQPDSGEYGPLEVVHLQPAFELWAKGMALASSLFLVELFLFWSIASYRTLQDSGLSNKDIYKQLKLKLKKIFCRETSPANSSGVEMFLANHHRRQKMLTVSSVQRKVSSSGKALSPSDFRRILWRDSPIERVLTKPGESVVNRRSTMPIGIAHQSEITSRWKKWKIDKEERDKRNKEPVVRYVDTDSFFSSLF